MDQLRQHLAEFNFQISNIQLDGKFHEFNENGKKGWYIGQDFGDGKIFFTWGDWRTGQKYKTKLGNYSSDKEWKEKDRELGKLIDEEKEKAFAQTKSLVQDTWNNVTATDGLSPYLNKKGFNQNFTTKVVKNEFQVLETWVPMVDAHGDLWNIQRISEEGVKSFAAKAKTDSVFAILGPKEFSTILICEGYATGCSLHLAMPEALVVCAMSLGNLELTAKAIKKKYRKAKIWIAADNDARLGEGSKNVGVYKATELAKKLDLGCVIPHWVKDDSANPRSVDWNDLLVGEGIGEVRRQLSTVSTDLSTEVSEDDGNTINGVENKKPTTNVVKSELTDAIPPSRPVGSSLKEKFLNKFTNGVATLPVRMTDKGKVVQYSEVEVATHLMSYYGDSLVRFGDTDFFIWTGTHWQLLEKKDDSTFKNQIRVAMDGDPTNRVVDGVLRTFKEMIPFMPRNPWKTDFFKANFVNGTLRVCEATKTVTFGPHSKSDCLVNVIPYEYKPSEKPTEFLEFVHTRFSGDEHKEEKIRAYQEMAGAVLFPAYPKLFLIYGAAGTGKSSLITALFNMISIENCSFQAPEKWGESFGLEPMIGKMANFVTDINTKKPLPTEILKIVEDSRTTPITMNRKSIKAIPGYLPGIHVFGANELPVSTDQSDAYDRRWIIIKCPTNKIDEGEIIRDYGHKMFLKNPSGVINWAVEGFLRILKNDGRYTKFESSVREVTALKELNNPVVQFVKEIEENENPYIQKHPEGELARSDAWNVFVSWHEESYNCPPSKYLGKQKFFDQLRGKFREKKNVVWKFEGLRKSVEAGVSEPI